MESERVLLSKPSNVSGMNSISGKSDMKVSWSIRPMTIEDYEQAFSLWEHMEGLAVSEADSREQIERYLNHNPGCSFVCDIGNGIAGTVLAGHDGRRGFLYHLAVDSAWRGRGIGEHLVEHALQALRQEGIEKCHIFVISGNEQGERFWLSHGWEKRDSFHVFSRSL